jgi:hypothetical protein
LALEASIRDGVIEVTTTKNLRTVALRVFSMVQNGKKIQNRIVH